MKNIKFHFTLLVATVVLAMSCRKKDETVYINPELKKHFSFKKGSYWIYRDSLTGGLDTFTTYDNNNYISRAEPPYPESPTERHIDYISCNCFDDVASKEVFSYQIELSNSSCLILFPKLNMGLGMNYDGLTNPDLFKSFTFGHFVFDSVFESKSDSSACYSRKDIGLIKIRIMKESIKRVWELQQWKIVE
jgi:hypothetical protein